MNKGIFGLTLAALSVCGAVGAQAASLRFAGANGEALAIGAPAMEEQLGMREGTLAGVTVLSLPDRAQGVLVSQGVEVLPYDYLDREALESCVFVPFEEEAAVHFSLLPDGESGAYTPVSLLISDRPEAVLSVLVPAGRYGWALAASRYYGGVEAQKAV